VIFYGKKLNSLRNKISQGFAMNSDKIYKELTRRKKLGKTRKEQLDEVFLKGGNATKLKEKLQDRETLENFI
jgi:hypothetical protein